MGPRYVSRGGEKLAGALDAFGVDPSGRVCLDVGASTGGFTDCLLQRGARRVYALDVGRGQLADSLRADGRVVSMERTHAARLDPDAEDPLTLPERVELAVADVSFISLTRLLRGMAARTVAGGDILPMVKPQFELSPRQVPHGVVRDRGRPARSRGARAGARRMARAGVPRRGRIAAHGAVRQPRVLPAPARAPIEDWPARVAVRWPGAMRRIGFAFNPTQAASPELRERALAWCRGQRRRGLGGAGR